MNNRWKVLVLPNASIVDYKGFWWWHWCMNVCSCIIILMYFCDLIIFAFNEWHRIGNWSIYAMLILVWFGLFSQSCLFPFLCHFVLVSTIIDHFSMLLPFEQILIFENVFIVLVLNFLHTWHDNFWRLSVK